MIAVSIILSISFFLSLSLDTFISYSYLAEISTFSTEDREIPRFFGGTARTLGESASAMPLDWLSASLSYFSFSLSWISMAHSPC